MSPLQWAWSRLWHRAARWLSTHRTNKLCCRNNMSGKEPQSNTANHQINKSNNIIINIFIINNKCLFVVPVNTAKWTDWRSFSATCWSEIATACVSEADITNQPHHPDQTATFYSTNSLISQFIVNMTTLWRTTSVEGKQKRFIWPVSDYLCTILFVIDLIWLKWDNPRFGSADPCLNPDLLC